MAVIQPTVAQMRDQRSFIIRSAQSIDAEALFKITVDVIAEDDFIVSKRHEYASTVETELQWIRSTQDHPSNVILVAEVDEEVVGFISFQVQPRERKAHCGHFHMLISADYRNQGIGSALVHTLMEWTAEQPQIEKICFAVFSNNKQAIHVYQKFGFKIEGRKVREIKLGPDKYIDEIHMGLFVEEYVELMETISQQAGPA